MPLTKEKQLEIRERWKETVQQVQDYKAEHDVTVEQACEALQVEVTGYYKWKRVLEGREKPRAKPQKAAKDGTRKVPAKAPKTNALVPAHPKARELADLLQAHAGGALPQPKRRVMAFVVFGDPDEVADTIASISKKGGLQ